MGSGKSKPLFEHGRMQVLTSKPSHVPGEIVYGQIQIQLEQSYPSKELVVEIIGHEKVYWKTHENKSVHIHKGKQEIYRHPIVLSRFPDGILPVGQYTFAFTFELPPQLVSSFVFRRGFPDDAHMRLKYKIIARMKDDSGVGSKPLNPMYAKRPLLITANELKTVNVDRKISL